MENVLENIAFQGLPPFGSLLLAIIATNPRDKEDLHHIETVLNAQICTDDKPLLKDSMTFLRVLSKLPTEYKKENRRIDLFRAIFKKCHYYFSVKNSVKILDGFKHTYDKIEDISRLPISQYILNRDLRPLALLKEKYPTTESIIKAIAGLPELPDYIELEEIPIKEIPVEKDPFEFIEELKENQKTFEVGSLVRRIWSGLNIPVQSSAPSQQPLGGVSDLTNKGELDKLLISEFANEDIIFLSRLANNEALYFHRETPPSDEHQERLILIDVSLKNWGTPKTIAYAILVALANHPKTNLTCYGFVIGQNFEPIRIDSVHDIIDALWKVDTCLHPAEGLQQFFKEHESFKDKEVCIISSAEVMKDTEILKVCNENLKLIDYMIHCESNGTVDVYKNLKNSKKHLQQIKLPLKELWNKKPKLPLEKTVLQSEYPILFGCVHRKADIIHCFDDDSVFLVNTEKKVFKQYIHTINRAENKGWELVFDGLPFKEGSKAIAKTSNGEFVMALMDHSNKAINLINLNTNKIIRSVLSNGESRPTTIFFEDDKFYWNATNNQVIAVYLDGTIDYIKEDRSKLKFSKGKVDKVRNFTYSLFKNIRRLFINDLGNLVFNVHELRLNGQYIQLKQNTSRMVMLESKFTAKGEFTFGDGSVIQIDRSGMIILKSSNPAISTIYIPSILENSLGVATEDHFAGNEYYFKEPLYQIHLENAGDAKLQVVKEIKYFMGIGLREAKDFADNCPIILPRRLPLHTVENLIEKLVNIGAKASKIRLDKEITEQKNIRTDIFYSLHIEPFIKHIQNNAS